MYDATTASNVTRLAAVQAGTAAAAGYCDANFASVWIEMIHTLPVLSAKQWVCSIGTRAGTICRIFDVEPGNPLTPAEAAVEVKKMVVKGVYRPGVYTMGSLMPSVRSALKSSGLKRGQYTLWLADPTGVRPTAQWLRDNDLDAMQYGWSSKGQAPAGTDVSAVLPDFFPEPKPKPAPKPTHDTGTAVAEIHYKTGAKHPFTIKGVAGEHVVFAGKRQTHRFHGGIETGDGGGGWHIHRGLVLPRISHKAKPKA